ncbi:G-type lectin S-receptor-like serine/threonine-protein kinase At2g19130 [Gastrolobium bilobum]|uniref:G-type lectin S-receptor-like serine/threonine-protein kinase At2g19130 n=1 Tax=Gastrolobium bilobum TaxID=150636 RepID=UPI002AAF3631|nr:G-type lectin S-receptor-like serine/threonine-protein kinase At2g19130 [Gastrolobium bilobum]
MLKNGSESKFCNWAETIYDNVDLKGELAYACFSNDYSDNYVAMTYNPYYPPYDSYPASCLARYVLDVSGQLKLFVWWSYLETWQAINTQEQTCESHSGKKNATWIVSPSGNKDDKKIKAKESGKKKATRIIIVTSAWLALLFVGITVLLRIAKRKDSSPSFKTTEGDTLTQYKLRDLRRATKNFTQKIGKGGFSTVYKGEFPDSTFIAVKKLQDQLREEKQLRAELNTLGLIQHKFLVRLLGFCLEDSKRFIIYDYMPNGSLESHLFQKGSNILDWETRYRIAVGTAKGLAYIHEECRDCIIHCDIKPENILLDAEYNPQVADFGLAKLPGRNFSRVLTTMRGTRGYLAPEWFSGGAVTAKVDVYSYGQVLFEIISGRRNMDLLNDELNSYFPAMILNALNNGVDLLPLVDSKLEGELNMEELCRACKVACWCIQDDEKDRPNMTQVVQILEGLVDVGIPPIPWFFQSIAEASINESDIKGSEAYSTSSTLPTSFTFQPPVSIFRADLNC